QGALLRQGGQAWPVAARARAGAADVGSQLRMGRQGARARRGAAEGFQPRARTRDCDRDTGQGHGDGGFHRQGAGGLPARPARHAGAIPRGAAHHQWNRPGRDDRRLCRAVPGGIGSWRLGMKAWREFWQRLLSPQTARFILALLALFFAAGGAFYLMGGKVEPENKDAAIFALGALFGLATNGFNYYF